VKDGLSNSANGALTRALSDARKSSKSALGVGLVQAEFEYCGVLCRRFHFKQMLIGHGTHRRPRFSMNTPPMIPAIAGLLFADEFTDLAGSRRPPGRDRRQKPAAKSRRHRTGIRMGGKPTVGNLQRRSVANYSMI
jgi:hypothetical protein